MKKADVLIAYADELHRIGKSENTIKTYLNNIGIFLEWCEESSGEEFNGTLTQTEVRMYKSYLDTVKKASLSTINTKLSSIQNFCDFLHMEYGSPLIKVEKKKGKTTPKVEVLDRQELFQFLKYVDGNANLLHKTIVYTILNTGMRESEVADLELDDIINLDSTKGSYIIVRSGKGDKYREIHISGEYKAMLREYIEHRPHTDSTKVFIGNRGTLTANGIYKMISRLGEQKGLHVYPHMLRHQYLTAYAKKCHSLEDIKALQETAGHSSIDTTMKFYVSSSSETKQRICEEINLFE
nr:MAG: Telomere resolvase [Bacteriophage sp.]